MDQVNAYRGLGLGMEDAARGAAMQVKKFLFDYTDEGLTEFEREGMKRIMPFYSWTRNNLPLQLEQLLKQPGKYAAVEKVRKGHEYALGPSPDEYRWPSG